jgi:hypothetical protein
MGGHVACTEEIKNPYKIFSHKTREITVWEHFMFMGG